MGIELALTDALAGYAAILSTLVFYWGVTQSKPKINVEIMLGLSDNYETGIYILIKNPSAHTVHIEAVSILTPYEKVTLKKLVSYLWNNKHFPPSSVGWAYSDIRYHIENGTRGSFSLEPGTSHKLFVSQETLKDLLHDALRLEVMAAAHDQLGQTKFSRKFSITG